MRYLTTGRLLPLAVVVLFAWHAPQAGAQGGGSCCSANGTPGCSNNTCEAAVCAVDPFCCGTEWDGLCADQAAELCSVCGGAGCGDGGAGNCFVDNGTPACNNAACCAIVCEQDPFCCETEWDGICGEDAAELCGDCGQPGAGSCYVDNDTPGCNNLSCCQDVCAIDPFCCLTQWDGLCADEAAELCGDCGQPGAGSCYVDNDTPGCNDLECCQEICAVDPFCCSTQWDGLCADAAAELCGGCGGSGAGNCCVANGTIGCNDLSCCQDVCAQDTFCCNVEWDQLCADAAQDLCDVCDIGACCIDGECSTVSPILCAFEGGEYQGDGTNCDTTICGIILPFGACCLPDGGCSQTLLFFCTQLGGDFQGIDTECVPFLCGGCDGDVTGDGDTNSADLNVVLGNFGCTGGGCAGDANGNGSTNSTDLNIVLGNFGCDG